MYCSVRDRSDCTNFSPDFGTRPLGRKIAVLDCQRRYSCSCEAIETASSG